MTIRNRSLVSLLCLAAPLALAQQGRVEGPVTGYVFDGQAQALRPVLGIPGASVLGDPVNLGAGLASGAVSPRLDSVIAVATDGTFHIYTLNAGAASEVPANGIPFVPERVVFSPTGSAAALYGGGRIQVVTGLPGAPKPGNNFDISALLALPRGRGHQTLTGSGVHLMGAGAAKQLVAARGAAVAFAPGTHDAAIAAASVTLVKDVGGAAAQQLIAAGGAGPSTVGAAFSADGSKLFVAAAAGQGVTAFDLAAGTSSAIRCDCTPAGITGMGNVYRLNEVGSAPLWLLDTTATTPRIVFVPVKTSE
jgi:hypothetical protein